MSQVIIYKLTVHAPEPIIEHKMSLTENPIYDVAVLEMIIQFKQVKYITFYLTHGQLRGQQRQEWAKVRAKWGVGAICTSITLQCYYEILT